jgi:Zn-dependent alcohol dehydrogenase
VAKIRSDAVFEKICAIGRAIAIGIQGVINTARLQPGSRRPTILTRS